MKTGMISGKTFGSKICGRLSCGAGALLLTLLAAAVFIDPTQVAAAAPPDKAAPVEKWAGIEVGSKGVKPVVMGFTKTPDGWDYTTDTTPDSRNTDLGTLSDDNKGFDPKRLAATLAAIGELDKALRDKHGISAERTRVVVSSGVFTRFKDKDAATAARAELTAAIEKATGRAPDFINEQQEAELAARSAISPAMRTGKLLIDIGSGNSRYGWYTAAGFQNFTLDSGTKAFRDAVAKEAGATMKPFAEVAPAVRETAFAAPLRAKIANADGLTKVTDVQIIGGAAWAMTTLTHPGTSSQTHVSLAATDVEKFAELAGLKPEDAKAKILGTIADSAAKETAMKEVERVQKVFSPEELQAAAEILRAIFAEGKLADKKVSFYQKGQSAWMAGYLMTVAKLPE